MTKAAPSPTEQGTLLPARADEIEGILSLARQCGLPEVGIAENIDGFLVARDDAGLIGVCGLEIHAGDGLLRTLAVAREHRGRGIGRQLVETTLGRARARGLGSVYLLTTSARRFFARLGFVETPRETAPLGIRSSWEFQTGCPESAAFMRFGPL